jgi:phosphopantetheinyl transferase
MLADLTDSPPERWTIERALSGAPVAHSSDGCRVPSISLSHSGSWVACAASFAGAVGIDVELHKERRDHHGIAEYAFGIQERAAVARFGAERFYAVWTLREAMAKATGEGLRQVVDSVDRVAIGPMDDACWSALDDGNWWLMHRRPSPGLSLAAALRFGTAPQRPIELHWWPFDMRATRVISRA